MRARIATRAIVFSLFLFCAAAAVSLALLDLDCVAVTSRFGENAACTLTKVTIRDAQAKPAGNSNYGKAATRPPAPSGTDTSDIPVTLPTRFPKAILDAMFYAGTFASDPLPWPLAAG